MGSGLDDYWDRTIRQNQDQIPEEFGGPVKGVSGKKYEQLEFDFDFLSDTDAELDAKAKKYKDEVWALKNNVGNYILQAKAVIDTVMDSMGSSGFNNDTHEFALWGASELLQNASDLLE